MSLELERSEPAKPISAAGHALLRCGADLVYLVEELYLRLFTLTLLLMLVGCAVAILFGELAHDNSQTTLTWTFAVGGVGVAAAGLARPRAAYLWLRYSTARQLAVAGPVAVALLISGPDSPSWWIAMPLLWVIATVSSSAAAITAAFATAAAYLAGTLIGGQPLIDHSDAGILSAAVALPANTLVARVIVEVVARFVLRLSRLEQTPTPREPVRVTNMAPTPGGLAPRRRSPEYLPSSAERLSRLTARQLEVALLTRDGLLRGEIAVCLGISPRQVERLLHDARVRVGAANANELVAMLVTGRLASHP